MSNPPASDFGQFAPGFEFLQNLVGQTASGMVQGLGGSLSPLSHLTRWVAPTFDTEELDKRIQELKAVQFWVDQNAKALNATIQALEVQKMTLATLQSMNCSLGDVASALKIKPTDTNTGADVGQSPFGGLEIPPRTDSSSQTPAPDQARFGATEPAVAKKATRKSAARVAGVAGGAVDPVQWWGALSQQFQTIAANALKDMSQSPSGKQPDKQPGQQAQMTSEPSPKTVKAAVPKRATTGAGNEGAGAVMNQPNVKAPTRSARVARAQPRPRATD